MGSLIRSAGLRVETFASAQEFLASPRTDVLSVWCWMCNLVDEEKTMYTGVLIPLDGSKTAEKVLPYARFAAGALKLPIELLAVVDIVEMATHISADRARYLETMIEDSVRTSEHYLRGIACAFPRGTKCTVEKGKAEQVIIETAAADKGTLITMATHGRSGIN